MQATFALLNWALRETVAQLAFGRTSLSTPGFLSISYTLLLALYSISVLVPSVWTALSLTGSTAAVRGWEGKGKGRRRGICVMGECGMCGWAGGCVGGGGGGGIRVWGGGVPGARKGCVKERGCVIGKGEGCVG